MRKILKHILDFSVEEDGHVVGATLHGKQERKLPIRKPHSAELTQLSSFPKVTPRQPSQVNVCFMYDRLPNWTVNTFSSTQLNRGEK